MNQEQIDKENDQRGKDLTMENGEPPRPNDERHWSEREKDIITEMLTRVASPNADWKSANELDLWSKAKTLTSVPLPSNGGA